MLHDSKKYAAKRPGPKDLCQQISQAVQSHKNANQCTILQPACAPFVCRPLHCTVCRGGRYAPVSFYFYIFIFGYSVWSLWMNKWINKFGSWGTQLIDINWSLNFRDIATVYSLFPNTEYLSVKTVKATSVDAQVPTSTALLWLIIDISSALCRSLLKP